MTQARGNHKLVIAIGLIFVVGLLIGAYLVLPHGPDPVSDTNGPCVLEKNKTEITKPGANMQVFASEALIQTRPGVVEKQIVKSPAFDYKDLETDSDFDRLMKKRLQEMGMEKSLDMVILSDESFKMGDDTISMQDILEKAHAKKKEIHESRITEFEQTEVEQMHRYGIYVVQPGDNIWNIHFNVLKEYYASQGIHVANDADEPTDAGYSSGIGKILKFSEILVIIYNVLEEEIVTDIDLIKPMSKLVIYNMDEVFNLLSEIDVNQIDQIRFDGRTLWIPAPEA
ncbi:MAG: hypothetical protein K9K63_13380 [Desulfotignum sp.]|nr:hypothetical protein [Desulfotignum sp.]MCF8087209.1 hypothetical protein [Desulfotignum sp.]MCF8138292.1 hypothetical protein [Desulfotignum sp.]